MVEHSSPNGSLTSERAEVLLVCSTGGHLLQLLALRGAWADFSRVWVTFDKTDARSLLAEERVVFAHGPTNRNFGLVAVRNLLRNLVGAARLLRVVRPRVVLTTGAGVAVPYAWIGRALGARVVYVESLTRIEAPSLSCRLIAPVASRIYAQWPELTESVPRARYLGSVVSGP
jgi:UDP-N-acetylglucosamine:LPS N-acetylglucosamine transferase